MSTPGQYGRAWCHGLLGLALLLAPSVQAAPQQAPAWSLKTPAGETVDFPAAAQGRPTVLLFWPSWCPFSRALQPYVQAIWEDYRAAGVNVWTLNIREDRDPVAVLRERGLSFPLLINADAVANDYGLQYTPWLVVIDGDNRIVYTRPPKPPTPVHTAKEVRTVLNRLLGAGALPLPQSYPKPYDLHLKDPATLNRRLQPVPVAAEVVAPWLEKYLAGLDSAEALPEFTPGGALTDGKAAIRLARDIWSKKFGDEATREQAPYRAYRRNRHWVVLGDGLSPTLGTGFVLVVEADSGRVLRVARRAA